MPGPAQTAAETEATTQRTRLAELGRQITQSRRALGQLASDSYVGGGGALADAAALLDALTAPSPDQSTDFLSTVHYLINSHARLLTRLKSVQSVQVTTSARAAAASTRATTAERKAAKSNDALDAVIAAERTALNGFRSAEAGRAAGLRSTLLRSGNPLARAADRTLARALQGQDYTLLMAHSTTCGNHSIHYANGRWPSSVRCALYAAPGQSLRRAAALAFNAMSLAYQRQRGSALCVTDSYRSYAAAWAEPSGGLPETLALGVRRLRACVRLRP